MEKARHPKGCFLILYIFIICIDKQYYIPYNIVGNIKERSFIMIFNTGAALLDAIVLSVVSNEIEGTYGYKITQDVKKALDVSESTLYPVLRRLMKDECLETYDKEVDGRNRRYYKITDKGTIQLEMYRGEWFLYVKKINQIIQGGGN